MLCLEWLKINKIKLCLIRVYIIYVYIYLFIFIFYFLNPTQIFCSHRVCDTLYSDQKHTTHVWRCFRAERLLPRLTSRCAWLEHVRKNPDCLVHPKYWHFRQHFKAAAAFTSLPKWRWNKRAGTKKELETKMKRSGSVLTATLSFLLLCLLSVRGKYFFLSHKHWH